jgi:hypothetical protein
MSKDAGDIGEIAFMLRARQNGLNVLSPYSAVTPYDFVIDNGKNLLKVQIKLTDSNIKKGKRVHHDAFRVCCGRGTGIKTGYTKNEVDFFVFYIIRHNLFYIIPQDQVKTISINLYPSKLDHKFNKYLENWDLLK